MKQLLLIGLFFIGFIALSQELSNLRSKIILLTGDTILLDTLSIVPQSAYLLNAEGGIIPEEYYQIDFPNGKLINRGLTLGEEITIKYRVFPFLFSKPFFHKSAASVEESDPGKYSFFTLKEQKQNNDLFGLEGLNKNGSISRGINFGNNQDLSVRSNFDLQLSGRVTEDISIQAAISDNNLPIQAEGNTQQLQEFDRVFIRLYNENSSLIAGDFLLTRPPSYFMNLNKKVQGGGYSTKMVTNKNKELTKQGTFTTSANVAISRGKFSRNIIPGVEGNQGPYQLKGSEGESFIIVLSGTERVYLNGKLMKRGQDQDYIIDYNTSELIFMPQQIINKDKRIVVEFQYSERNYSRSLFFVENAYTLQKWRFDFNVYSEQDNKNQPLQQDLSDAEKRVLTDVGDRLNEAFVSGVDSVGFIDDQVLYEKRDSLGFQGILVYSKDPQKAKFRAKFTFVGQGKGNYTQISSDANGRVFKWISPIAGIPQGSFEPVILLVSPKKKQLITLGTSYNINKENKVNVEGAFSNNDLNTFSTQNDNDNQSLGLKVEFKGSQVLSSKDSINELKLKTKLFHEQIGKNFKYIERYRNVEFDRDWNYQTLNIEGNEYYSKGSIGLYQGKNLVDYEFSSFLKGLDYKGFKHAYQTAFYKKGFSIISNGSFLKVEAKNNSDFVRHYTTVKQKVLGLVAGAYLEQEKIRFFQNKSDTITPGSFDRIIWKSFIEKGDSSQSNAYTLSYSEIYDFLPNQSRLSYAQKSENFALDFKMANNPKHRLSGNLTYRKLLIQNNELSALSPENTILGRIDHNVKALKGFLDLGTFYQIGSGLENKREFSFLKVNDGQGTHVWIDFNNNQVKELNEFEIAGANNSFQANYIKVFTPTSDFIRVFSNQFNQVLFLKPAAIIKSNSGFGKYLAKFSNKSTFRAERKTQLEKNSYNPFYSKSSSTDLITLNAAVSNTFYFNRLNPKFGMDYYYLNSQGKSLLTNGFDSRSNEIHELKSRFNFQRIYSVELRMNQSDKANRSEFFASRNYTIRTLLAEPSFIYQPSVTLRVSLTGNYSDKNNRLGEERAILKSLSSELRLNQAGKGTFSVSASFIKIDFNSSQNSSLSFEMLDGLQPGNNVTWNLSWQKNLSNYLQLSLDYGGRKSDELNVIHTGGMQIRAFF